MTNPTVDSEVTFATAIQQALDDAMREDPSIVVLGQDVAVGFPFGVTRGLIELYGSERIRDTPISEAATMGCGVGAALTGLHPVVEVDFSGFLLLGLDQLVNNAAKLRYMSGGQLRVPLVVRVGQGAMGSFAAQHSQSIQGWLANVPGLAVCMPSDPQDAYSMMRWSLRQSDPVIFAEDMRLYRSKGRVERNDTNSVSGAKVLRKGRDATALAFGYCAQLAVKAADELAALGIELEVVDLRFLSPIDELALAESVSRTGRVICIGNDPLVGGFTSTIACLANEYGWGRLEAPVLRLGARHAPAPYSAKLESKVFPTTAAIVESVHALVEWGGSVDA